MDMEKFKNKLKETIPNGVVIDKDLLDRVVGGVDAGLISESAVLAEIRNNGIVGLSNLGANLIVGVAKPDGTGGGLGSTRK